MSTFAMKMEKPITDPDMESEFDKKDFIIIDSGSETIKIGYSGEDTPRVFINYTRYNYIDSNTLNCRYTNTKA